MKKTNKVTSYIDKIFIVDVDDIKNLKEFEDVLYDVFEYGNCKKWMFVAGDIFQSKIKKYLEETPHSKNGFVFITAWGEISPVHRDNNPENNSKLIFVDDCEWL